MKYSDIIKIKLTNDEILEAVSHARKEKFLDNLRNRNEFVSFDSKIRGYIGEIYLKKIFSVNCIKISGTNHIDSGQGVDVDIEIVSNGGELLKVECKTSLIPDCYGTIQNCISKCDIKIIKREKDYTDIPIDVHIQIYFNERRKERDGKLSKISGSINDYSDEEIVDLFGLNKLEGFFVAWIDRKSLNDYLFSLSEKERIWSYAFRNFWKCPLASSYEPEKIIEYLKNV